MGLWGVMVRGDIPPPARARCLLWVLGPVGTSKGGEGSGGFGRFRVCVKPIGGRPQPADASRQFGVLSAIFISAGKEATAEG